jgi:hypothetical protein
MGEIGTIAMSGAVAKGDNDRAIADYSNAIENNPQDANANAYFDRAAPSTPRAPAIAPAQISPKQIEANPRLAAAHYNRAVGASYRGIR